MILNAPAEAAAQWRARYRRPATVMDPPEDRDRGFVDEWTDPGWTPEYCVERTFALSRPEETLAKILYWEVRQVEFGHWHTRDWKVSGK